MPHTVQTAARQPLVCVRNVIFTYRTPAGPAGVPERVYRDNWTPIFAVKYRDKFDRWLVRVKQRVFQKHVYLHIYVCRVTRNERKPYFGRGVRKKRVFL